jgi:hypothetical protein
MLDVQRLDPLLWTWTTDHPQWTDDAGGWERHVRSVFAERPDAVVLIDPLVPIDPLDAERFYAALDRDLERRSVPLRIVCTIPDHRRSCGLLRERYDAGLYAPRASLDGVTGAEVVAAETSVAEGVVVVPLGAPSVDHLAIRIDGVQPALVFGDTILGRQDGDPDGAGELVVPPLDWFQPDSEAWYSGELPGRLDRLAEGVEVVIPSHGAIVSSGGGEALRAAAQRARGRA